MFRILYRLIAMLARLAVRSGRSKDLEIIVLRHQLTVLRREINRPALNDADRSLLGAIAAALPKAAIGSLAPPSGESSKPVASIQRRSDPSSRGHSSSSSGAVAC